MRARRIDAVGLAASVAVALAGGAVLSSFTTRVVNWFVMTDELFYERLAISVAHTGSALPRLHGDLVVNVNQLYPYLLSFVYGHGDVPGSLAAAHRLNAFLFASAAIPVYLLGRRVGLGVLASLAAGAVSVAVPWAALASFLLTEVVAYPVFCWALLALVHAVERRSAGADVLALAAIGVAVLARTQFLLLLGVLALAVLADAAARPGGVRALPRERRLLVAVYALAALVVAATAAVGEAGRLLGPYAVTADGIRVDLELGRLVLEHVAVLALGLAIAPLVLGVAWLLDRLRPSATPPQRAVAAVGLGSFVLVVLQVASFDQRFGEGLVKDRYLFYVVPVVVVAVAASLASRRQPPAWAVLAVAGVCAAGFALVRLPTYEKLNADSPLAALNDELLRLSGSLGWARVLLVAATVVAAQLLLLGRLFLPARAGAAVAAALLAVALPAQAAYAFERLFRVPGTNGLDVTFDQGVVFNWVDRQVGADGRATMLRYPVNSSDYWAGVQYWWDLEFWNESVVENPLDGLTGVEPWLREFDPETGRALRPERTRYAVVHQTDVRFRLAGRQLHFERSAYLLEPERPWRAGYVTSGIYGDGWTRPHTPARIRVFAAPGQATPVRRFLTVALSTPDGPGRPVSIRSNTVDWRETLGPNGGAEPLVSVCVPPGGHGDVEIATPVVSAVYRDPSLGPLTGEIDRPVGVLLRWIALADEQEPLERCPAAP